MTQFLRSRVEQLNGRDATSSDLGLDKADAVYLIRNATETASTISTIAKQLNVTAINKIMSVASTVDPEKTFGKRFDRMVADAERLGGLVSNLAVSFASTQDTNEYPVSYDHP